MSTTTIDTTETDLDLTVLESLGFPVMCEYRCKDHEDGDCDGVASVTARVLSRSCDGDHMRTMPMCWSAVQMILTTVSDRQFFTRPASPRNTCRKCGHRPSCPAEHIRDIVPL